MFCGGQDARPSKVDSVEGIHEQRICQRYVLVNVVESGGDSEHLHGMQIILFLGFRIPISPALLGFAPDRQLYGCWQAIASNAAYISADSCMLSAKD